MKSLRQHVDISAQYFRINIWLNQYEARLPGRDKILWINLSAVTIWWNLYSFTHTYLTHPCLRGLNFNYRFLSPISCRSQWPRGLRRKPAAARLVGWRVRISVVEWMSVPFECCVLSGTVLCEGADRSSRGVLLSVVCLSVIVKPR
jgi:hypothetical protein